MGIEIRPAATEDLDALFALLDEVAAWLQAKGLKDQWPASFSKSDGWSALYRGWMEEGNVFIAKREDRLVGTFRLTATDPYAWPAAAPEEAWYLHTLAVSRSEAGAGLGRRLLDWVCEEVRRRGRPELRLDCWDGNQRLQRYYTEAGFTYRGEQAVVAEGGLYVERAYTVSLFARSVD